MPTTKPRLKIILEPAWVKVIWDEFPGDNMSNKIHQCIEREIDRLNYQRKLRDMTTEKKALKAVFSEKLFAD